MKDLYISELKRNGFGVIDNTGHLDVIKGDYKDTIILDDETEKDQLDRIINYELFKKREKQFNEIKGIRVGDWVRFPDGSMNRVTHIWEFDNGYDIQTGGGGSYYLGDGYISHSGGLDIGIDGSHFTITKEVKKAWVWFFKNDYRMAHNGIDYKMDFRVFDVDCYPGNKKDA